MKPENAIELQPWPNVSTTGLEDAALLLPAAHVFTLRIAHWQLFTAKNVVRELACQYMDNVLSPYINIVVDDSYSPDEWSLQSNDKIVWSRGA